MQIDELSLGLEGRIIALEANNSESFGGIAADSSAQKLAVDTSLQSYQTAWKGNALHDRSDYSNIV
jgi:hypothetical protein